MIRTRIFDWVVRGPNGPGWLVSGAPEGWYPGPGFLAAHDTLEHLSNKPDWAHELRAAGAAAVDVRGMERRTYESIAEDVIGFAAKDHHFNAPTAPARWSKPLDPRDERSVQALASEMRQMIAIGIKRLESDPFARESAPKEAIENAPHFVDKALPWIRLGYAGAKRVFGPHRVETGQLLDAIASAINEDHEKLPPVKGDRLVVRADTKARTFTLTRSGNEKLSHSDRFRSSLMDELFGGLIANSN